MKEKKQKYLRVLMNIAENGSYFHIYGSLRYLRNDGELESFYPYTDVESSFLIKAQGNVYHDAEYNYVYGVEMRFDTLQTRYAGNAQKMHAKIERHFSRMSERPADIGQLLCEIAKALQCKIAVAFGMESKLYELSEGAEAINTMITERFPHIQRKFSWYSYPFNN